MHCRQRKSSPSALRPFRENPLSDLNVPQFVHRFNRCGESGLATSAEVLSVLLVTSLTAVVMRHYRTYVRQSEQFPTSTTVLRHVPASRPRGRGAVQAGPGGAGAEPLRQTDRAAAAPIPSGAWGRPDGGAFAALLASANVPGTSRSDHPRPQFRLQVVDKKADGSSGRR
jgi:hypothetical protein